MTEFRRLISYIYEYEGKVKGKNVGFVKLETRNGLCKLNVSVKKLYLGSGNLGVYLLSARREIFLGNLFLRNGGGEFRTVVQAADIEQSGETMDDCYGLTIHEKKDSWKVYTTIWEDVAAQAAEVAFAPAMEENNAENAAAENIVNEGKATENTLRNTMENALEKVAENALEKELGNASEDVQKHAFMDKAEITDGTVKKEENTEEPYLPLDENKGSAAEDIPAEETKNEAQNDIQREEKMRNAVEENKEKKEEFGNKNIEKKWESGEKIVKDITQETMDREGAQMKPNGQPANKTQPSAVTRIPRKRTNNNAMPVRRPQGQMFFNIRPQSAPDGASTASVPRSQQFAPAGPLPAQASHAQQFAPAGPLPTQAPHAQQFVPAGPLAAPAPHLQQPIVTGFAAQQPSSMQPDSAVHMPEENRNMAAFHEQPGGSRWSENQQPLIRQHEEEPLIIGDPEALAKLEEEEKTAPVPLWDFLSKTYPKIQAFECQYGCEILVIKPQDIGLLPREVWIYGNNSFLLHGYYNYRYLILARLENPHGAPRHLLGVPGHYYSNEKYMASMFGFPNFVLSKKQQAQDGRFGYWYTDIRLGDGNVASAVIRHSQTNRM